MIPSGSTFALMHYPTAAIGGHVNGFLSARNAGVYEGVDSEPKSCSIRPSDNPFRFAGRYRQTSKLAYPARDLFSFKQ